MPGSIVPKLPNGTYGGVGSGDDGMRIAADRAIGIVHQPRRIGHVERLPNGGADELMLWYSPDMKSYPIA